jgi:conjugal transfer mating pair stabilization protein TraN
MRLSWLLFAPAALLGAGMASGQSVADIRADAEALARDLRAAAVGTLLADGAETNVPGYQGTDIPASDMADDPDRLTSQGEAQRSGDTYRTVIDPHRPVFDPTTIDLSSARSIAADPDAVLGTGMDLGGGQGACEPLPAGGGGDSTYLDSCNEGSQVYSEARSCQAPLVVNVTGTGDDKWEYSCHTVFTKFPNNSSRMCNRLRTLDKNKSCQLVGEGYDPDYTYCLQGGGNVLPEYCTEPEPMPTQIYQCSEQITGFAGGVKIAGDRQITETIDESQCSPIAGNQDCRMTAEVCTDASPATRTINGTEVTRACWGWQRQFQCDGLRPANDCTELEGRSDCSFHHDECLSEDANGTCNVYDRWFQCRLPGAEAEPPQYVCSGDLYCMNGECSNVERQASTEFKDAMVAVQTMGEVRADFDPNTLRLFTGEVGKCSRKVFGISNCCSGKGVPLLTPWLCNAEDRAVDQKDDKGLCHQVGTYCSDKILGVCVTRKQSYCCFSSKLTRILQEQGRAQLGLTWGSAKEPNCQGFLVEQFQQLDLSRMDFSEVYAEFTEAARLPDEIEASMMIQQRIGQYYTTNGAP